MPIRSLDVGFDVRPLRDRARMEQIAEDDDRTPVYQLDPTCPACGDEHDVGDVWDGCEYRCFQCRARLVAVAYGPSPQSLRGIIYMHAIEREPWKLTGKAAERARRRRRGRQ